jgi:hypothetical protein
MNLLNDYPEQTTEYLRKLLNERKHWSGGSYVENPNAVLFQMGFTTQEALDIVTDYVEPAEPEPPLTPEEQAQKELEQYRKALVNGPVQLRRALRAAGHKQAIEDWLATADPDIVEDWEHTTEIKRMDPMVLDAQASIGATDEEVDQLFELGKTLA